MIRLTLRYFGEMLTEIALNLSYWFFQLWLGPAPPPPRRPAAVPVRTPWWDDTEGCVLPDVGSSQDRRKPLSDEAIAFRTYMELGREREVPDDVRN
jgi:hypothetical protein